MKNIKIKSLIFLFSLLLITSVYCQQPQPDQGEVGNLFFQYYVDKKQQVRQQQYKSRDNNRMNYQNVQSYTLKSQGVDSFFINPVADQQVKCELYVYWKQSNIFISSEYREGEEIRILVYQDDQRILVDSFFYMVTGFSFNVKKGSAYEIKFLTSGKVQKLISLTISKMADNSDSLINSSHLLKTEQRISSVRGQIQAFFSISQRNLMIQQKLTGEVLKSTQLYMGYQIVEIIILLIITTMQTLFITKALNTNSIV